jgi:hypothetical protein
VIHRAAAGDAGDAGRAPEIPARRIDGGFYGARLLRPSRPHARAARELFSEGLEGDALREGWERAYARGIIDAEWLTRCPDTREGLETGAREVPPTGAHAAVFVADPAGVRTATELGRALAQALSAWGACAHDARVVWTVCDRERWRPAGLHPLVLLHARATMPKASLFDGIRLACVSASRGCPGARDVADILRFAALWRAAAEGTEGPSWSRMSRGLAPEGYPPDAPEAWPDPWEPWLGILALGYAVGSYARGELALVAPESLSRSL